MTDKELLKKEKINIFFFENDLWPRSGVYIAEMRTMFVNSNLSDKETHKVILHELGHKEHVPSLYQIAQIRHENEANRKMFQRLISESIDEYGIENFNLKQFMDDYGFYTISDEVMIRDEFYKLAGSF